MDEIPKELAGALKIIDKYERRFISNTYAPWINIVDLVSFSHFEVRKKKEKPLTMKEAQEENVTEVYIPQLSEFTIEPTVEKIKLAEGHERFKKAISSGLAYRTGVGALRHADEWLN